MFSPHFAVPHNRLGDVLDPSFCTLECYFQFNSPADIIQKPMEVARGQLRFQRHPVLVMFSDEVSTAILKVGSPLENFLHSPAHPFSDIFPAYMQYPPTEGKVFPLILFTDGRQWYDV